MSTFHIPPKITREWIITTMRLSNLPSPIIILNNWHHTLILNNIDMNRNLRMIFHHCDFVTIDWNELGLLDQQFSLLQNDIMHGNLSFPTHLNFLVFPWGMGNIQEDKKAYHVLKINHGFAMFQQMEDCHKLTYMYIYMFSLHWPPSPWLNLDPN